MFAALELYNIKSLESSVVTYLLSSSLITLNYTWCYLDVPT